MPAKNALGSPDGGKLMEHLAAEDSAFDGEPASLAVVEENSFLSELLPECVIRSEEVLEGVLLPPIDPAGEDEEPPAPWLKLGLDVPPDARLEFRNIPACWHPVKRRTRRWQRPG
ncbi:MAG: hypothetical protein FJW35_16605, partial [Acidobacteria bacterium]|nr:hypothetical protein [Acidobacteriota bacterium]